MIHRVTLSSGQVLLIEEGNEALHVATETPGHPSDVDMYVCAITQSGVMVMPNSGTAVDELTRGLVKKTPGPWSLAETVEKLKSSPDFYEHVAGGALGQLFEMYGTDLNQNDLVAVIDILGQEKINLPTTGK